MQLYRGEQRKDFQGEKDKRLKQHIKTLIPKKRDRTLAEMALAGDVKAF
ncbi:MULTISPECIES: hypothetical protein [Bacillaceae]|nr:MULTISPECIES: hypothetical protein [Bacillaceae]